MALCVLQGHGAARAVPAGGQGTVARQPPHHCRMLVFAGRKSRHNWVSGCSPCLGHGLWAKISWHGHHNSAILGFAFPTKEGGTNHQDSWLPPNPLS